MCDILELFHFLILQEPVSLPFKFFEKKYLLIYKCSSGGTFQYTYNN